jgi:hypothetical protein
MIHHTDTEREDREVTRELYTAMGIVFGCVALAFITVALWP